MYHVRGLVTLRVLEHCGSPDRRVTRQDCEAFVVAVQSRSQGRFLQNTPTLTWHQRSQRQLNEAHIADLI